MLLLPGLQSVRPREAVSPCMMTRVRGDVVELVFFFFFFLFLFFPSLFFDFPFLLSFFPPFLGSTPMIPSLRSHHRFEWRDRVRAR